VQILKTVTVHRSLDTSFFPRLVGASMEERFSLESKGMRIVGINSLVDDHPRPTAILLHGFTGSKDEDHDLFVKTASHLVSCGIHAVRFDFRYGRTGTNMGESDGTIAEMTPSEWIDDARSVTSLVSEMPWADPCRICLIGLSMGGLTAICEAATDERIAGVAAWSAPSDLSVLLRGSQTRSALETVISRDFEAFERSASREVPRECISSISPRPILIVGGTADRVVTIDQTRELFERAGDPRSLHLIGGANHTFGKHESEVISTTASWLRTVLGGL
jgi:alpha-beta hydrolase superfamily lysophospholipase